MTTPTVDGSLQIEAALANAQAIENVWLTDPNPALALTFLRHRPATELRLQLAAATDFGLVHAAVILGDAIRLGTPGQIARRPDWYAPVPLAVDMGELLALAEVAKTQLLNSPLPGLDAGYTWERDVNVDAETGAVVVMLVPIPPA